MRYTKKEFAKICGIKTNELAVYIERGKVILTGSKIDDELPDNAEFILKNQELNQRKEEDAKDTPVGSLETQKKKLDIQKTAEEVKILRIKEQKLRGELFPTELFKILIAQFSKGMVTEFENSMDKILLRIAHRAKLSNKEMSEMRGVVKKEINNAVSENITLTNKAIKDMVGEFIEKRGRGEKI